MRIVFMGSAALAIPSLSAIIESEYATVVGVVSQPDRPAGRKRKLTPNPLKVFADEQGLHVLTPEKVGDALDALASLKPDLFIVVAYGQYISSRIINLAHYEAINVHPSLLPKYRGSAPIQWAIANGDKVTGVSIIYLAKKMDAGDILRQETYPIEENDTSKDLHDKLAVLGASLLIEAVNDIRTESVQRTIQNDEDVVEISKLLKSDGEIDWALSAEAIRNRIRAFDPWPGSTCRLPNGDFIKVWAAEVVDATGEQLGEILDDELLVATGNGALRLTEVQPVGKKRMPAKSFLNGFSIPVGSQLE
jgi:methionyl-tRNA formyltransferase